MRFISRIGILAGIIILSLFFEGNNYQAEEPVVLKSGKAGSDIVWTMYDDGRLVFSGTGAMKDTDWSTIASWYGHIYTIENVIFEEGITYIGECAFRSSVYYCETIKSVTIPSTVTEIGEYAFAGMLNLEAVYITDLEQWCNIKFHNNDANPLAVKSDLYVNGEIVEHLVIPNSVTEITDYAFMGCTSLKSVDVHKKVMRVGSFAFNTCSNLKEMYFYGDFPVFGKAVYVLSYLTAYYPQNNNTWVVENLKGIGLNPQLEGEVTWIGHTLSTDTEVEETETESEEPKTEIIKTESEEPKTGIIETESEEPKTEIIETESEEPKTEIIEIESEEVTFEEEGTESEKTRTEAVETESQELQINHSNEDQTDNNHVGNKVLPILAICLLVGIVAGVLIYKKRIK